MCSVPGVLEAQIPGLSSGSNFSLSPRMPEPFDQVTVSLSDYSINTNGATIAWFVDGSEVTSAANERSLTVSVGAAGSETEVVSITTLPSGIQIPTRTTLTPVRVDILVEGDTVAPVFYKGRAIPAEGSEVSVTAIPYTGEPRDPKGFSYRWKVNDDVVGGSSQFGKNRISFSSTFGKNIPVSVEIYDSDGSLVGGDSTVVSLVKPELHFYEVNPLRGLSEHTISRSHIFVGSEINVRAEPYFLDKTLLQSNPFIEWKLNAITIENPSSDPQEITLRKQGDSGSFNLSFHIRNLRQLLQGVEDTITIRF